MRQTTEQQAGRPKARRADPSPIRFIAVTMAALIGVGTGAVIGATAYRFEQSEPATSTSNADQKPTGVNVAAAKPQMPEGSALDENGSEPGWQSAGVTVVTPTSFEDNPQRKPESDRQKPNILTVASIIKHAEETRPAQLSATSPRFGDKPAVTETATEAPSLKRSDAEAIDDAQTGSIASFKVERTAVAKGPEVDEMQSELSKQNADHFKNPTDSVAAAAIAKGMRMNKALKYVSLRALPDKNSAELAVVPAGAELLAETDCDRWCGAVFEGQDGYVYYTYLRAMEHNSEDVDVAETEDQVVAMERRMAAEDKEHFRIPATPRTANPTAGLRPDLRKGWTTKYVNLRSGPDNASDVLTIVPANSPVLAEDNCLHWCLSIYDGREGYIYKSFIRREASSG